LTSTVVTPPSISASSRLPLSPASCAALAARVAFIVETIPPPDFAISS
jgi:hypothetical protein